MSYTREERLPVSTETTLYIPDFGGDNTLQDLIDKAVEHFGECGFDDLTIESENIQIACFGYDLYDPIDWRRYFVVRKNG